MTHTSTELKQVLALADACAGDWGAVRSHLVVQALRDLVARVQELEAAQGRVREIAIMALLSGSYDRQDWIDKMACIEGITQEKQG